MENDNGPDRITDNLGRLVWDSLDQSEPEPGSVVLTGGEWGTGWQRQFHDGLWHSTRRKGGPKTWAWLLTRRNLVLVYDAEPRPDPVPAPALIPSATKTLTHLTGADVEVLL